MKFTVAIVGPDATALRLDQMLGDRQAEAGGWLDDMRKVPKAIAAVISIQPAD